jgi:hypothetical protein
VLWWTLIWGCESKGVYSSNSFYAIINYRGVKPIYIPAIWNIVVPPKIQLFLWLLSHNKLATVDNLNRKGFAKPTQCCFYNENESAIHFFFECAVARAIWDYVQKFLGTDIGSSYISVASKWLQKEKCYVINIISTVVLRGLRLIRNDFIFNKQKWVSVRQVLRRMLRLTTEWMVIVKEAKRVEMEN